MKVRYYGHVGQGSGYARAAEGMCRALLAAGLDLEIRPLLPWNHVRLDPSDPLIRHLRRDVELTPPDATIVHTLPLDVRNVLKALSDTPHFAPVLQSRLVAYTTLEFTGRIERSMVEAMDGDFDEFWFPCQQNVDSVGEDLAAYVMPHAYDPEAVPRRERSTMRDRDTPFTFYYVGAWCARKNPEGLIRAFTRAFTKDDPVRLILQCAHARNADFLMALARVGTPQAELPKILFRNQRVSDAELWHLHHESDCFVTASRGEAWNLPAFEAMLIGRHIISPCLGSEEFLADTSMSPIASTPAPAGADAYLNGPATEDSVPIMVTRTHGYTTKTCWQEPDLIQLADTMREVFKDQQRYLIVDRDPAERYSYAAVGALARQRLENIKQP